jgi:tetratricopeptide (TPR) repeat protein
VGAPENDNILLGRILLSMGRLSQKQLAQALDAHAESDVTLGEALLAQKLITKDDILEARHILDVLLVGRTSERYLIDDEIGRGGMGAVLSAVDHVLRRKVAMKVLTAGGEETGFLARFVEEAQVTGQLEHPNIVPVHDLGLDDDGRVYFTMKQIQGESLADILEREYAAGAGRLSARASARLLEIFLKACDGVAFAHSKNVVHRDLKPGNIMVGQFGEVLVLDWGLARLLTAGVKTGVAKKASEKNIAAAPPAPVRTMRGDRDISQTLDGQIVGTAKYMAPEQAKGLSEEVDERADVYGLGVILYEILTGKPPFEQKDLDVLLDDVIHKEPPSPRTLNPQLERDLETITLKCLEKNKFRRYRNAGALADDLRRFLAGETIAARPASMFYRTGKFLKRHRFAFIAATVTVAAILAFGGAGLKQYYDALVGWDLVYQDDFNGGKLADVWHAHRGTWRIVDGELEGAAPNSSDGYLLLDLPVSGDVRFDFEARCMVDENAACLEAAAFCNASKKRLDADGYFASLGNAHGVKLQRQGQNVVFNLDVKPQAGRKYKLRLERIGGRVSLYVDGIVAARYEDPLPTTGGEERNLVGLYVWDAKTRFDNVGVWGRGAALKISVLEKGHVLFERGHYDQAADVYANIARTRPGTTEALEAVFREASCWLEKAKTEKRRQTNALAEPTPAMSEFLLKTEPLLSRVRLANKAPWKQYAQAASAECAYLCGDYEAALTIAANGAAEDRILRDAIRHILLRYGSLYELEKISSAQAYILALQRLYPEDRTLLAEALFYQARIMFVSKRYAEALAAYERLGAEYGDLHKMLAGKMQVLRAQGLYEEAEAVCNWALRVHADQHDLCAAALNEKILTFRTQERHEDSIAAADQVLKFFPALRERCAWALGEKGNSLRLLGKYAEALAVYQEVITVYPEQNYLCAWALVDTGITMSLLEKYEEACKALDRVAEAYPEQKSVWLRALENKAFALAKLKRFAEAKAINDELIRDYPRRKDLNANAIARNCELLRIQGRYDEALSESVRIVEEFADLSQVRTNTLKIMIFLHAVLGERDKVAAMAKEYLQSKKDDWAVWTAFKPYAPFPGKKTVFPEPKAHYNEAEFYLALAAYARNDDQEAIIRLERLLVDLEDTTSHRQMILDARKLLERIRLDSARSP